LTYVLDTMFLRSGFIIVAALLMVTFLPVCADDFHVTTGDAAGLSLALEAANANDEADNIYLQGGVFIIDASSTGSEYLSYVSSEITIFGADDVPTLIQYPSPGIALAFFRVSEGGILTLSKLTISRGGGVNGCGGAITVDSGGRLIVQNSVFLENSTGFFGGAICNLGGVTIIENSIFKGNVADGHGGAIVNMQSGDLTIRDSFFVGNEADRGGALQNEKSKLSIENSVIISNRSYGSGGGIGTDHSGSPSNNMIDISNTTIDANLAAVDGGGMDLHTSNASITGSTISNNSAGRNAGGVQSSFGTLTIRNSTISGNSADGRGGGIESLFGSGGFNNRVDMNNVTVTQNHSGDAGGGVYNSDSRDFRFLNSILAENLDDEGPSDCAGRLIASGHNLVQSPTESCIFSEQDNIIGQAPLLMPLSDNGGLTRTHALQPESPAIDAGNPASPGSGGQACELTDQRGSPRNCDIGAYEYDSQPANTKFRINAGLNDAWFDPSTSGQGFFLVVYPVTSQIFLSWFTYDIQRPEENAKAILGEAGHRWVTAQGPYGGDTTVLDIFLTSGGVFASTEPRPETSAEPIGTLSIIWQDCESGTVSYALPGLGLLGNIDIRRIAPDNVELCKAFTADDA
jgi:hypothetical protein